MILKIIIFFAMIFFAIIYMSVSITNLIYAYEEKERWLPKSLLVILGGISIFIICTIGTVMYLDVVTSYNKEKPKYELITEPVYKLVK